MTLYGATIGMIFLVFSNLPVFRKNTLWVPYIFTVGMVLVPAPDEKIYLVAITITR